jgi:hypothetical protein
MNGETPLLNLQFLESLQADYYGEFNKLIFTGLFRLERLAVEFRQSPHILSCAGSSTGEELAND